MSVYVTSYFVFNPSEIFLGIAFQAGRLVQSSFKYAVVLYIIIVNVCVPSALIYWCMGNETVIYQIII